MLFLKHLSKVYTLIFFKTNELNATSNKSPMIFLFNVDSD